MGFELELGVVETEHISIVNDNIEGADTDLDV